MPAPRQGYIEPFTEEAAKDALINARGDIFTASQWLGITALRMDRAIQCSQVLQATVDTIRATSKGISTESLHEAVEKRIALYRVVGLDALHDLAAMPIDENSAQNQVKLAAAARLAGGLEGGAGSNDLAETLRDLQKSYEENAPRLRIIRERMTVELEPRHEKEIPAPDDSEAG